MIILDILAVIGIVWILSSSTILKPIREAITKKSLFIGKLLSCWGCFSFWISLIYCFLPYREYLRFIFTAVIVAVFIQLIYDKIKKS